MDGECEDALFLWQHPRVVPAVRGGPLQSLLVLSGAYNGDSTLATFVYRRRRLKETNSSPLYQHANITLLLFVKCPLSNVSLVT